MKNYILDKLRYEKYYDIARWAHNSKWNPNFEKEFADVVEEITGISCNMNSASATYNELIKWNFKEKNGSI